MLGLATERVQLLFLCPRYKTELMDRPAAELSFVRLRVVLTVARTGSVTRAAEALYLSQPAVSQHIRAAEAVLRTEAVRADGTGHPDDAEGKRVCDMAGQLVGSWRTCASVCAATATATPPRIVMAASTTSATTSCRRCCASSGCCTRAEFVVHVLNRVQVIDRCATHRGPRVRGGAALPARRDGRKRWRRSS